MEILRSLYLDVYEGFLSEEEIELVLKNGDMWLSEKEICSRLDKRVKLFESRQKQAIKDMEDIFSEDSIPSWVLRHKSMTKANLIDLFEGKLDIEIDEESKTFVLIPVDLPEVA